MATSILMASDHDNNVPPLSEDKTRPAETSKQRGRRKSKANETPQKKKQPQRGMGVVQLERLRLQERWKKMTEMSSSLPSYTLQTQPFEGSSFAHEPTVINNVPGSFAKISSVTRANGGGHVGMNQGLYVQRVGNVGFSGQVGVGHHFHVDCYGVGGGFNANLRVENVNEASRELSSTPNMKCFSHHCGVCYKKKRTNGENLACNVVRDMHMEPPSINGCGFFVYNVGNNQNINGSDYAVGNSDQRVEVMAVHRKGSSWGGAVLMEYEFFPEKNGRSHASHNELMMKLSSETSSAADHVDGEAYSVSTTGVESSSSVDLSLKLYY